eukprot:scaffold77003_cov33-Tisochrysis_lutea.AAC.1
MVEMDQRGFASLGVAQVGSVLARGMVLQVLFSEQKDGAAVNIVSEEGGHHRSEAKCVQPSPKLFAVPHEHVALQPQHLEVRQTADGCEVLVAPLNKAAEDLQARSALAARALGARLLLVAAELHADVLLPHSRALQLEVVRVLVSELAASSFDLEPSDIHLRWAFIRLVLHLVLEPEPGPACPAESTL